MGIIPARAGFTKGPLVKPHTIEDHPRSRGVYSPIARHCSGVRGSSPLARGLPKYRPVRSPRLRIIPARAGFTRPAVSPASLTADHPRSRGVYFPLSPYWPAYLGSSPLARGLPARYQASAWAWGIIPARAGFTPTTVPTTSASWDHPRSRGVYPTVTARVESIPGSSPLARGLPGLEHLGDAGAGIIPARAGFTATWLTDSAPRGDHPRSRGVYGHRQCRAGHA